MAGTDHDTIVVGGGVIGLATAYYSARAGRRTLLLERGPFHHDQGSSSGNSRFFRIMYSEEPMAVLAEASYALWKQLEMETGTTLIDEQPLLFFGDKTTGATVEGDFGNADRVMARLGVPFETLDAEAIRARYPVFKELPASYTGLVQRNSAVIQVERSRRVFHDLAVAAGATLVDETAAEIEGVGDDGRVTVRTPDRSYTARSLAISAGAWTNELIAPLGVSFVREIWKMTVGLYEVEDLARPYPFWYEFAGPDQAPAGENLYYGFPVGTDREGCIKASCDFTSVRPASMAEYCHDPEPEALTLISEHLQRRFHGIRPEPVAASTCMYTMSADYHVALGLLPGFDNVAILTGESGRGFKYAPLFGRILSQLASDGTTAHDISSLSLTRPGLVH